jgi:hypothetical protein
LLNRAHKATAVSTLAELTVGGWPAWVLGGAEVRVIVLTLDGTPSGCCGSSTGRNVSLPEGSRPLLRAETRGVTG